MMLHSRFGLVAVVAAIGFGCSPPTPPPKLNVRLDATRYSLANGLEVVLQEDHHAPSIAVHMRYHAGAKDDPPGKSGLAHLTEHLTFAGTRHVPPGTYFLLGSDVSNGDTHHDSTDYHITIADNDLEKVLWVLSDEMAFVTDAQALVDRERSVVTQERRQHYEDPAYGNVRLLIEGAVFPEAHPYHHTGIGTPSDVNSLTRDDIIAFRRRYYSPDNATLVVVGDFDADRARAAITRYFDALPPLPHPPDRAPVAPVESAQQKRIRVEANVERARVYLAWPLPPPGVDGYWEAQCAISIVEWSIERHLTEAKNKAGQGWYEYWSGLAASLGTIVVESAGTLDVDDLLDDLSYARRQLSVHGNVWKGARECRQRFRMRRVTSLESLSDRAALMQDDNESYGSPDASSSVLETIGALEDDRITDAIDHFLDPDRATIAVVVPTAGAPRGGRLVSP